MEKLFPQKINLGENAKPVRAGWVLFLKCVFAGSTRDGQYEKYELDNHLCKEFKKTLLAFKNDIGTADSDIFGPDDFTSLADVYNIDLRCVPASILSIPTIAIDPDGNLSAWPISRRRSLFPDYLDYHGIHPHCGVISQGPIVLLYKCLLCFIPYLSKVEYNMDCIFDDVFAKTIASYQRHNDLDIDKCFGPDTRWNLSNFLGRDINAVSKVFLAR